MKRYLAFAYPWYYPSGGAEDLVGDFDNLDAAKDATYAAMCEHGWQGADLIIEGAGASILDIETGKRLEWRGRGNEWRRHEQWVEIK